MAGFPFSEWLPLKNHGLTETRQTKGFCYTTTVTLTPDTPDTLNTMLNRAFQLSSTWKVFSRGMRMRYPETLCGQPFADSLKTNSCFVFHRGFKHEKTDESTRPQAECFYRFGVFETPMKHEARVFEITSPTKEN